MYVSLVLVPLDLCFGSYMVDNNQEECIQSDDVNYVYKINEEEKVYYKVKTPLKSINVLKRAMLELKYDIDVENKNISFMINKDDTIDIVFSHNYDLKKVQSLSSDIYHQYSSIVQEDVYKRIKLKSKEIGYVLEKENVQDDMSIAMDFIIDMDKELNIQILADGRIKVYIEGCRENQFKKEIKKLEQLLEAKVVDIEDKKGE